jgi:segregation and condensation protein B
MMIMNDLSPSPLELKAIIEALIFVAEEPLSLAQIAAILPEYEPSAIEMALSSLINDYEQRGLELREIAGGWRLYTRSAYNEQVRRYLKARPSAKLSLAALETLAVIAYKQPITIPEILEIRGVSSSSAIKTLLDRKLIVPKGRKECIGRPIMYGTSKDFLLQFGLKDLKDLPKLEDLADILTN